MQITQLLWLADIIDKIIHKHHVQPEEVKEVFDSQAHYRFVEKGHRTGENVYVALGQTDSGRYLIIFFVYKPGGQALILSARDMTQAVKRQYEKA